MLTFEYPFAFVIILFYIVGIKFLKAKKESFYFSNVKMLKFASKKKAILINLIKFITILSLSIALASPIKKDEISTSNSDGYEIALLLDASGSMRRDNKFEVVKKIMSDFIDKRQSDALGLAIYADFAYTAVPLTYDKESIKRLLERIEIGMVGVNQTALYEALFLSSNLFKGSKAKNKIIILPTDGFDNATSIPIETAIQTAQKYGIKVYTIGVGTLRDFDPEILKKIADETGGNYYHASSNNALEQIYSQIDSLEKSEIKSQRYTKKTYYFEYFLGLAFVMMSALFLLTNRKVYV